MILSCIEIRLNIIPIDKYVNIERENGLAPYWWQEMLSKVMMTVQWQK